MYEYYSRHHFYEEQERQDHDCISGSFVNNPSQRINLFPAVRKSTLSSIFITKTSSRIIPTTSSNSIIPSSTAASIKSNTSLPSLSTLVPSPISNNNNTAITNNTDPGGGGGGGEGEGGRLSAGAITGIVIGTLLLLVLILFMAISAILRRRASATHQIPPMSSVFRRGGKEKKQLFTSTDFIQTPPATTTFLPTIHAITTNTTAPAANNPMIVSLATSTITSQLTTSASISQLPIPPIDNVFTVISSYTQTLDDELPIEVGDQVQIVTKYDDGWCLGINLTRNNARGVLPQHCCSISVCEINEMR